jgi:two-component system alkaline phosphatase synthesis response regulator PhoP
MPDRILVVEDEELVSAMVRLNLEHAGYTVHVERDGRAAEPLLVPGRWDLVVLDVMLPGLDGFTLARRARAAGVVSPILMLTARALTPDKVEGLDAGADDYLAKPFAMPELLARVRALIRRHTQPRGVPTSRVVTFDRYEVNLDTREALSNEGRVTLTETECQLLAFLAAREGELLPRTDLLENVWGMDRFPTARTVDNYILRLRKLFEPDPESPVHILTVRGRGYRFVR